MFESIIYSIKDKRKHPKKSVRLLLSKLWYIDLMAYLTNAAS